MLFGWGAGGGPAFHPPGKGGVGGRVPLNPSSRHHMRAVLPGDKKEEKLKTLTEVSEYVLVTSNIFMLKRKNELVTLGEIPDRDKGGRVHRRQNYTVSGPRRY